MVAKTPPKVRQSAAAPPDPNLLRETITKVDKCMARLQELQFMASGVSKTMAGDKLSPRTHTRRMRCKNESSRLKKKAAAEPISPSMKTQEFTEEWKRMSLPAMLVCETMAEIRQTSRFAKEIAAAASKNSKILSSNEPATPILHHKIIQRSRGSQSQLRVKRKTEKQEVQHLKSTSPKLRRVCSRIKFRASPIRNQPVFHIFPSRASPKRKQCARKPALFPHPLFLSSPSSQNQKFCKTRSPIIGSKAQQGRHHRFIIKSPTLPSKAGRPLTRSLKSPTLPSKAGRPLPRNMAVQSLLKRSPKMPRLRHSLSPARLVSRLASPLKNRVTPMKNKFYSPLRRKASIIP